MTTLSPSELVFLQADQFIEKRYSPDATSETVLSNRRKVNRRLMMIETVRAAILTNAQHGTARLELIATGELENTLEQIGQLGKVGSVMAKILDTVGEDAKKPQTHLTRLETNNPWQTETLESLILSKLEHKAIAVNQIIFKCFGYNNPASVVGEVIRNNLLKRGILEKKKGLFGTSWTLTTDGQHALATSSLEPIQQMYQTWQQNPEHAACLEKSLWHAFAYSDD
jgi:hypothetical protein